MYITIYINSILKQEKRICSHLKDTRMYEIKYMLCRKANLNIFHGEDTINFVQTLQNKKKKNNSDSKRKTITGISN